MSVYKKTSFTSVGNLATFLGNIKTAIDKDVIGTTYGWTIDRYTAGNSGEILAHANGMYGNQNLFYSIKLRNPTNECAHIHLCGQQGYNSVNTYDNQPGKFTDNSRGLPGAWDGTTATDMLQIANFVRAPITKMVVFCNKQAILVFWKEDMVLKCPYTYPVWKRFIIGAMDSLFPTTELYLNFVDETIATDLGFGSSPFMGSYKYHPYNWTCDQRPTTGLLYKQPFDVAAENKDIFNNYATYWGSTITSYEQNYYYSHSWNGTCYYSYTGGSYPWDYRLIGVYNTSTRYNQSVVKHNLHRPIVYLYENVDSSHKYLNPIGYLPYYAVQFSIVLSADDTISYGTRNFSVFPVLKDSHFATAFHGIAIEFV